MKKKINKSLVISSLICLLPMLISLFFYNDLPAKVAIHWNFEGVVDGYASKLLACFGLPLFLLFLHLVVIYAVNNDPKRANVKGAMINLMYWFIPILSLVVSSLTILSALGHKVNVSFFVPMLVGLLLVIIGNYLPKCKQNYTVGIKLPWTLHSQENWNKTHRLGGLCFIICGFLMMISAFLMGSEVVSIFLLTGIIVAVLVPTVYSFVLFKKGI